MSREHVKFHSIREDFNEYKVENGQILRMKLTLTDVLVEVQNDQQKALLGLKDVSVVITDPPIDTSTLEYAASSDVMEKDEIKEMKFAIISEIVNIYETTKFIILVSPNVKKISMTNKKDKDNHPILRFSYETNIAIIDKLDFSTKQTSNHKE